MNIFYEYQYGENYGYMHFAQFGTSHWMALLVSILLIFSLPLYAKHRLSETWQNRIGNVLAVIVFSNIFIWMGIEMAAGTFELKKDLPLHLCRVSNLLTPLVLIRRNAIALDVLYAWAFSGVLQATLTPDLQHEFPHFMFFRYWIGHPAVILAVIYAIIVYKMIPSKHCVRNAMIGLNVYVLTVTVANLLLDSNYFFLRAKPATKSALDLFGDWPWYLVVCEVLFLANFSLTYLPFAWKRWKEARINRVE
ncbi:MAG: TIGR02206 family membrane protein [Bacteroidia bacterium]